MYIKLPLIEFLKKRTRFLIIYWISGVLFMILPFILPHGTSRIAGILIIIWAILFGLWWFSMLALGFMLRQFREIGHIFISTDYIVIDKSKEKLNFDVNLISNLEITFGGYDGAALGEYSYKSGENNKICFIYQEIKYEYQFYIKYCV